MPARPSPGAMRSSMVWPASWRPKARPPRSSVKDSAIGEASPSQGTRTFTASLTIQGKPAAQEVCFLVLGLDPVLIFGDQDFQQFMDMDNAPVAAKKAYRQRGRRATATSELPIGQGITRPRAWSVRLRRSRDRLIGAGGIATA